MGDLKINKEEILKALSTVPEPDLKKDLVTLNMIKDIELGVGEVRFTVVLTTPACPLKEKIRKDCENAIHEHVDPNLRVVINMTADVTTTRFGNSTLLPDVKNIIAVASGKGGVGKSTVTANLAMALKLSGAKVGIIDADISGPSIPVMFGAEDLQPMVQQIDGKNMIQPIMQYGIKMISMGFLAPQDNPVPWRGPMATQALRQFFGDTHWGELDYLLIDLPPGTSDIHLSLVQLVPVTGAVVVTTPQKVALADATKGLMFFRQAQINVPVLGVVENMAYFTPEELPDNKYYIFGKDGGKKLAEKYETELLGSIPLVQGIREGGDEGKPVVMGDSIMTQAFKDLAENVAQQVAIRNATIDKTTPVQLKV
ncbi:MULTISPECIES: Mrp/NBP35 family ATP-binding protein [Flectobacillus]|jgi:ATP-binding protein involved in chromosome partitioning|uniref:Iron-sulfur cluster carrier protein n=1 Tax=Flectobacillus roseus TaxID=502259 RepID=A0ABT6YC04_9BACT|nr:MULTISPECIES: Mrp/NBP35 family ATP-binding protein [Flectobacillus]MDI9861122.1 Mrp/NBP35 family ATP-binding protein [Flectobacillus roseus]MDI9872399.1 Mrp/NBP35 family ATP-binding protein [Flectobacillus roseus]NBA76782.1 P-loop NTPase [Emticicia sp. ODNR4P]PAC32140.1 MRP family ATP-binding protein [Flectobacillus sp. BAB-3569]